MPTVNVGIFVSGGIIKSVRVFVNYQIITQLKDLERVCQQAREADVVMLDTEFVRTRTYYPQLGLIQLFDGETLSLIDPIALDEMTPFVSLLKDASVLKVLHACGEDLEVFQNAFGCTPTPMVDTQIMAAFLGHGLSTGFAALVSEFVGIDLDKSESRTDWLARPLSQKQLDYAAADVYYYGDHYGTNLYAYDTSSASNVLIADLTNHGMPDGFALSGGADFYNGTYYYSPEKPENTPGAIPQQATDIYAVNFSADGLNIVSHSELNVQLPAGWVSFGDFGDIAVDSSTGILYGSSTSVNGNFGDGAYFWSIDLNEANKQVTVIDQNNTANARAYQIAYNAIENAIFANQFESNEYVVIDKQTGTPGATVAVAGDFYDLASTVLPDKIPEPSSTLLLGLAASVGIFRRKRG